MQNQAKNVIIFNNILTIIKPPLSQNFSSFCEISSNPTLNVIEKCKGHPTIVVMKIKSIIRVRNSRKKKDFKRNLEFREQ